MWSPPPIRRPETPTCRCTSPPLLAKHGCATATPHTSRPARSPAQSFHRGLGKEVRHHRSRLEPKIDALAERRLIWGDLIDSAHVVRQFGNDAARGDVAKPASQSESKDVLDTMDELLHQLFTTPARSRRFRDSREQRREQTSS